MKGDKKMAEIRQGETLEMENLMSFRGKVRQQELEKIGNDLELQVKTSGAERVGYPITVTYGIEGDLIDVEVLLPINKRVPSTGKYVFKEKLLITNALMVKHVGNPAGLQAACNELNSYIMENKLVPITAGYNVTRKVDMLNPNNAEIDVYVGISPNIL